MDKHYAAEACESPRVIQSAEEALDRICRIADEVDELVDRVLGNPASTTISAGSGGGFPASNIAMRTPVLTSLRASTNRANAAMEQMRNAISRLGSEL